MRVGHHYTQTNTNKLDTGVSEEGLEVWIYVDYFLTHVVYSLVSCINEASIKLLRNVVHIFGGLQFRDDCRR